MEYRKVKNGNDTYSIVENPQYFEYRNMKEFDDVNRNTDGSTTIEINGKYHIIAKNGNMKELWSLIGFIDMLMVQQH